jgi:hypothetical protein
MLVIEKMEPQFNGVALKFAGKGWQRAGLSDGCVRGPVQLWIFGILVVFDVVYLAIFHHPEVDGNVSLLKFGCPDDIWHYEVPVASHDPRYCS